MSKKEVRFGNLVAAAGKPEPVTPWADPKQDRSFMRAVHENRVVTLIQEPRSKRDYGMIGFHQEPHAAYLIFPHRLPGREPSRVIGIKYDLMSAPKVLAGRVKQKAVRAKPPKPEPEPKDFSITLKRIATLETSITVTAPTKKEARQRALEQIRSTPFDTSKAIIRDEVTDRKSGRVCLYSKVPTTHQ